MQKYKTIRDFSGNDGAIPMLKSVCTAVPIFFPVILFLVWIFGTGISYYIILKTTGKKRFWQSFTGMSFATFVLSLIVAAMNEPTMTYLSGYWVGFYIVATAGTWFMLANYK